MLLDDLIAVIETLKQRIADHGPTLQENETRTRMALIDPLLQALGWDTSDPRLVTPEYDVNGRRADYALLGQNGMPAATLEAKKLGAPLSTHLMQMLTYSNSAGIDYAGITDGNSWELYEVFRRGQLEERRMLNVRIAETPAHKGALQLLLLWRPNLASGQPVAASEPIVALPSQPDSSGWMPLSDFVAKQGEKPPISIRFPDESEFSVQFWYQLVVYTVDWLWSKKTLTTSNVPLTSSKQQRYVVHTQSIHPSGSAFNSPHTISGTPLFVEKSFTSDHLVENTKTLLEHCGQDLAHVHLQVEQKGGE